MLRGARERLSPILMTALATGLALVPLVIAGNIPGHEIEHPMAVVILGGLVTSTLLNLFIVPSLYLRFGRGRRSPSGRTGSPAAWRARRGGRRGRLSGSRRCSSGCTARREPGPPRVERRRADGPVPTETDFDPAGFPEPTPVDEPVVPIGSRDPVDLEGRALDEGGW